jgi:hypothetical protein
MFIALDKLANQGLRKAIMIVPERSIGGSFRRAAGTLGVREDTGQVHIEIAGLVTPKTEEAGRICAQDLNEVIAAFVQHKPTLERGLFDAENTIPEEITQLQMGKIVRDRYPALSEEDQEAVRQHAIATLNVTQQARAIAEKATGDARTEGNIALIEGVKRCLTDVRDLNIDLIDRINPFQTAFAIIARSMTEDSLRQVQAAIAAKRVSIPEDEARDLAKRAVRFKRERGRPPSITAADALEKRMAEGVAALARYVAQRKAASG